MKILKSFYAISQQQLLKPHFQLISHTSLTNTGKYFLSNKNYNYDNLRNNNQNDELGSQNKSQNQQEQTGKYPSQTFSTIDQIVLSRRQQAIYLENQQNKQRGIQNYTDACIDIIIEFQLYMLHTCHRCQTIDAIMNYYKISYKRNMNRYYRDRLRHSFPELKQKEFPILRVHVSLEPVKFYSGADLIQQYLIQHDFIRNPLHKTNSAFAQQGIEFAETQVLKQLEILFWNPILTFENLLKSNPETYRQSVKQYVLIKVIRQLLQTIFVQIFKNIYYILKNQDKYKQARQNVLDLMNGWKIMLGDNQFHGGQHPDEADFVLYGVLKSFYNSKSFQRFIENKFPTSVYRWFIRMQQNCQYSQDRELYD